MTRLYGKSLDVYSFSRCIVDSNVPKYKKDNKKTTWEEVENSPRKIEMYLPNSALEIIEKNPIRIARSPLFVKSSFLLPSNDDEEPIQFFSRYNPIEEYKRELVLSLGKMLSSVNKDDMPEENDIPCEYSDFIGFFLESLYMKETGKNNLFCIKHFKELLTNAKRYVNAYKNFQNFQFSVVNSKKYSLYDDEIENEDEYKKVEKKFLDITLSNLSFLSSLNAVLQLNERKMSKLEIKELLDYLITNPNHNRQAIINGLGVDSYGFKSLKKEIYRRR